MERIDIAALTRENVKRMKAYSSARDEFKGEASIWLDANESPFDNDLNRYPDPLQIELKKRIAERKGVALENIFVGNGSDEAIDLLFRAFCEPGEDEVMIMPPTYGMYRVSANLNNVKVLEVPLDASFQLDVPAILEQIERRPQLKLIFICSPNNPTGNGMRTVDIARVAEAFHGLVIVDEAYGDFVKKEGELPSIYTKDIFYNIVRLQTFSKAWGLASIRLGMAFADREVIDILNKIKPPYNVNKLSQDAAIKRLNEYQVIDNQIDMIIQERNFLKKALSENALVERVYPSDANFLLVKIQHANQVWKKLSEHGIIVRNRSSQVEGCLRFSIGTPEENQRLVEVLAAISRDSCDFMTK